MYFRYFVIMSPSKKGRTLHLNKLEPLLPRDTLCQVWLKLAWWFWNRRWQCEKFTTTPTTTTTDNGQILIKKIHLSLRLRWVNEHHFSKNISLNKNNDVSYMHVDNLYALVLLHFYLQMQHPGVFPLISNAPVTPAVR